MVITDQVHVQHWGTFISTPYVSEKIATVKVSNTLENHFDSNSLVDITVTLFDPSGKELANKTTYLTVPAGGNKDLIVSFPVHNPKRWDINSPELYSAKTILQIDGKVVDVSTSTFGIRSYEFTPDGGFYLNGSHVPLHGVCLHHDLGPLGSAFNKRAMERELEIMQKMGVNAVRTSHNPPARGLVELCDKLGLVVIDEAFDKWDGTADRINGQPSLEEHGHRHLGNLVKRDRNSPSVIVWSIGNEIGNTSRNKPGEGKNPETVTLMTNFVRQYDTTRPIMMGCHIPETAAEPILDGVDVVGYNYGRRYRLFRENYPHIPVFYSESASALSTRGFYALPLPTNKTDYDDDAVQVSSYDLNAAAWSDIPDVEFYTLFEDNFLAGEFVWTGFDYIGEPTPYDQSRSSYFGIVDLCGIPKDRFYLYKSQWVPDETTVHILPHWNWTDRVGKNVPVFVYTNGDAAELFLNGKSLGKKNKIMEVPDNPNLILNRETQTSSQQSTNPGNLAIDENRRTAWRSAEDGKQWWQVDLGSLEQIRYIAVSFAKAKEVSEDQFWNSPEFTVSTPEYSIKVSSDGKTWNELVYNKPETLTINRNAGFGAFLKLQKGQVHELETTTRFVRVEFTSSLEGSNGIREVEIFHRSPDEAYYDVTYCYRLRWDDVVYEPGELKAVAYKDGKEIGQTIMNTAGEPAKIRLTPDRNEINADGYDLSYILVEMLDKDGNLCPLADNKINFTVDGPVEIAAVGNGDQNSLAPFQADYRKLFYGKSMLIVRSKTDQTGQATINASTDGVPSTKITVECK